MDNAQIAKLSSVLSTPLICDACIRLEIPVRVALPGIRPIRRGERVAGRVLPARHSGSVDVFLEALEAALPGDVMVIDNGGRHDEGCIGDLTVLEMKLAGLAGVFVWGAHRDSTELLEIGFPVFSYGTCPTGPLRLDPRPVDALTGAFVGGIRVDATDFLVADDDGVAFAPLDRAEDLLAAAREIRSTERRQTDAMRSGASLRDQLRFADFKEKRARDPSLSFRDHLRTIDGAIEE